MAAEKTVAMTFRVTPQFKRLLESAAEREHRSNTNMLEKLLLDHCAANGLVDLEHPPTGPVPKPAN